MLEGTAAAGLGNFGKLRAKFREDNKACCYEPSDPPSLLSQTPFVNLPDYGYKYDLPYRGEPVRRRPGKQVRGRSKSHKTVLAIKVSISRQLKHVKMLNSKRRELNTWIGVTPQYMQNLRHQLNNITPPLEIKNKTFYP